MSKRMRFISGLLLFIAALAATAFACAWPGTSHSVRFNQYQTERELGRLPPLPTFANGTNRLRVYWGMEDWGLADPELYPGDDFNVAKKRSDEVDALWDRAQTATTEGKLAQARDLLREYLRLTQLARHVWFDPTNRQERRNTAIDQLDALAALGHGSSNTRVQHYLNARHLYDSGDLSEKDDRDLGQAATDLNLNDNVAYLRAAKLYRQNLFPESAQAFNNVARRFPQSEKREASMFMSALASLKASTAYTPTSADEAHLHEDSRATVQPVVIDDSWHDALAGFKRVMTAYPRGRYFNDARGWLAYLMLRNNDRAGALVEYYRLLADAADENARLEAAFSLELVRHHATAVELSLVEKQLAHEPQAALAYAYHNIFNYSIDPGSAYRSPGQSETDELRRQLDREWARDRLNTGRETVERTLVFSRHLMESYPNLAVGGAFALRAAEASLELGNNEDAVQFTERALRSGINGDDRAQALWTNGIGEHRLRHFDAARKSLNTLLKDYPNSRLLEGARRTLAMIAEDSGDIDGALEQYVTLGYSTDVAYFVDVLMTTKQLADFIHRHPDSPKNNDFTYALGVRYLRANRWEDARNTLARVRTSPKPVYDVYSNNSECLNTNVDCIDPKDPSYYEEGPVVITNRLLMRDVQTANDLQTLERAVTDASGDEATAEALYQLASYQYEASPLLFYNPIEWSGNRYWDLSRLADENRYRTTNEAQMLFAYMQEHDTLARALKIYLEVVKRFPRTRAARDALYTTAVCHERLSDYNPYWREIYMTGLHAGSRMVTYEDVKAAYPNYQLPRGTYGWRPSNRTANGGPGWASPPKRVPRPTRMARLKLMIDHILNRAANFRTLIGILLAIRFTAWLTKLDRKLLFLANLCGFGAFLWLTFLRHTLL